MRGSNELAFNVVKDPNASYLAIRMTRNKDDGVTTYKSIGLIREMKDRVATVPKYDSNRALTLSGEKELTPT